MSIRDKSDRVVVVDKDVKRRWIEYNNELYISQMNSIVQKELVKEWRKYCQQI